MNYPLLKRLFAGCIGFIILMLLSTSCTLSFSETDIKDNAGPVTESQQQTQTPTNDVKADATIPVSALPSL